jgi:hypothetical protein
LKLLIAIVNYRSAGLVRDLLDSLAEEVRSLPGVWVRIGDNGSGDGSVQQLAEHIAKCGYSDFAELLDLERNGGFAFGNNRLIEAPLNAPEAQRPQYVLMLNPDTLVRPGAIRALLEFMNSRPDAGLAGSRLIDPDGSIQQSAFRFQGFFSEIDDGLRLGIVSKLLARWKVAAPQPLDQPSQCQWVAGASLIVRREVFERIGLMDEAYFLYFEEEDFCKRAADAGFTCWYVPSSIVVHLVGQTSGVTNKQDQNRRKPKFWFETRQRYFVRHYGVLKSFAIDLAHLTSFLLWRLRRRLQGKPDPDPAHYASDLLTKNLLASRRLAPEIVPSVNSGRR